MAKWSFAVSALTPVAVADATVMTNSGYIALQGGSSTQRNNIWEVFIAGEGTSSTPTFMQMARDSTVGATLAALASPNSNGPLDPATAALGAVPAGFISATTVPLRSNSNVLPRLNFTFNGFGGSAFWRAAAEDWCFSILGNTASLGEASLSAFTGGTPSPIMAHIIYEPK